MTGRIFDIQRFSIHDGPGIRTTVFMKGCSLECAWCHNPESISPGMQIQTYFSKCIGCGRCFDVCTNGAHMIIDGERAYDRSLCKSCGRCAAECYSGAIVMAGREVSVDELMTEIEADMPFYKDSDGGVTFSGGEPLLQSEFVALALKRCKAEGINTAVDTAGNVKYSAFERVLPYTDLFLYDLKAMDDKLHRFLTGVSNKLLLDNLRAIDREGATIRIRVPVITGANDHNDNFMEMAEFLSSLNCIQGVEPLPYHSLGAGKLESLGEGAEGRLFETPGKERMDYVRSIFQNAGLRVFSR